MDTLNKWLTLIANIGVLIGIGFVAYELHQNTTATQLETTSNFQNAFAEVELMIASNPEFADLLTKGRKGEQLADAEFVRLQAFYRTVLRAWQTNVTQHEAGGLSAEAFEGTKDLMQQTFNQDISLLNHWKRNRAQFTPAFNALVEGLISDATGGHDDI